MKTLFCREELLRLQFIQVEGFRSQIRHLTIQVKQKDVLFLLGWAADSFQPNITHSPERFSF